MHTTVPLSQLTASRRNPRRVKPERAAHRRLVASIRAYGLLERLIAQPTGENGSHRVIAGNRRLAALRDVYRGRDNDPAIPCEVRDVDRDTADALSLSENFAREGMHPLDEAELPGAFAKLASVDCKGVAEVAAEFGVTCRYVRQRMKLAALAEPIKNAYREGGIETATAEAFAAVPEDWQLDVWAEVNGKPQHARHVQNIIANGWIDADNALFDVAALPESAVSRDLFSERVLIERGPFMEAQADALIAEKEALTEDGWGEVVIAARQDVQDRLYAMDPAPPEYDEATMERLTDIEQRRQKAEAELDAVDEDDEQALEAVYENMDALDAEQERIVRDAKPSYGEAGITVRLILVNQRLSRPHAACGD